MRGFLLEITAVAVLLVQGGAATQADMLVWSENAAVKVRPGDTPKPTPSAIEISAARNEYESFQIVVRKLDRPLRGLDVDLTDFLSGDGHRISCRTNCTIYREVYMQVVDPSGPYGSAGEWPDALIPKVDRYSGERRNAFPVDVAENRNQPVWIDVYVPKGTPPGLYVAHAIVNAQGESPIRIAVNLTVWAFTLPSTPSISNAFLIWGGALPVQHGASFTGEALDELVWTYSKALLAHRLSNGWLLGGEDWQPTALTRPSTNVPANLQQNWGTFFEGSVLPNGAQITAVVPDAQSCVGAPLCSKDVIDFMASAGWLDRMALYLTDEPNLDDPNVLQQLQSSADSIHQQDSRLRTFLTHSYSPLIEPQTDVWAVPLREMNQSFADGTYASSYAREMELGKKVWVYQSCLSHICGVTSLYPGLEDWPDYMIDMQGMKNRIQDWVNWKFHVQGELYWGVNYQYYQANPFQDQFAYGGNGDGNFFYPGTPEQIGGRTHIPIESIRLKLKREGLEDYEYLAMLARNGAEAFADSQAARLVQLATQWEHDPMILYRVRSELAAQLELLMHSRGFAVRSETSQPVDPQRRP